VPIAEALNMMDPHIFKKQEISYDVSD
jgi:hypothetical protein